jgi:hypothetical protein
VKRVVVDECTFLGQVADDTAGRAGDVPDRGHGARHECRRVTGVGALPQTLKIPLLRQQVYQMDAAEVLSIGHKG